MDVKKFGAFLASVRKENGLTQAELADKLHVTDKAVSRWERGIGFPDVSNFEPLAEAVGVSVVELIRSEKQEAVTKEDASAAVMDTAAVTGMQWKRRIRKAVFCLGGLAVLVALWFIISGFFYRTDTYLEDYSVLEHSGCITIHVGVAGSMGYIRGCRNISDDPSVMVLRFYSAFGGLNSAVGAQNVFVIQPDASCTEISFESYDGTRLWLEKDPATGEWVR